MSAKNILIHDIKPRAKMMMEWIHHFYIIAAFISIIVAFYTTKHTTLELTLVCIFGGYFVVVLVFLIVSSAHWGAKARYSESYESTHAAVDTIRDVHHYLERCNNTSDPTKFNKEKFRKMLVTALTALSNAYTTATAVRCRTCLKLIGLTKNHPSGNNGQSLDNYYVQSFARDMVSAEQKKHDDENENEKHIVGKNTDFSDLAEMRRNYFFEGNVWGGDHYRNTSFPEHKPTSSKGLVYNSVIVLPIRYKLDAQEIEERKQAGTPDSALGDQDLYGFLAIDAKPRNAFNERYDVQIGAVIADALHPVLTAYNKVIKTQKKIA